MRRDALYWYEEAIKMTAKLGAKGTGGHVGGLSMDDLRHSERKEYLAQYLVDSLQYLRQIGSKEGIIVPSKILEAIERSRTEQVTLILEVVHPFEAEETKIKNDLKESVDYWRKFLKSLRRTLVSSCNPLHVSTVKMNAYFYHKCLNGLPPRFRWLSESMRGICCTF